MSYSLRYKSGPTFAVVDISALAFADRAGPILEEIAARTREAGDRRLLVNLLDVVGTLSPEEHAAIGRLAAGYLAHLEKVASLVPPEKITRVSEAAAQAAGMQLRVFTNLTEAVDWLVA